MKREIGGASAWLFDQIAFAQWQCETNSTAQEHNEAALRALLREIWRNELEPRERTVLQHLHLYGKTEAAISRELGLHHSAVGRMRRRAEAKLHTGLGYALRYGELVQRERAKHQKNLH